MKKRAVEIGKYFISIIFFYAIFNYFRNTFGMPVFYDVFVRERNNEKGRRAVVVIGPQYSLPAFLKSSCVCTSTKGLIALKPTVVHDPDKNCMVILFEIPDEIPDLFKYSIVRGGKKLFSAGHVGEKGHKDKRGYKYKLSVTTLFKYETDFLREWVDYHTLSGVEHFYLYENNSTPDAKIAAVLAPYIRDGIVTHILWPYPYVFYNYKFRKIWPNDAFSYTQLPQINHSLYKCAAETEWLLSCDVDEYFYSPRGMKLTEAIAAVDVAKDVSSIRMKGYWFGGTPDEVVRAGSDGVLRTFIRSEKHPTSACKCIFNTATVRLASVHNSLIHDTKEVTVSPDILHFNHYRALGWKKRLDGHFAREVKNTDILEKIT